MRLICYSLLALMVGPGLSGCESTSPLPPEADVALVDTVAPPVDTSPEPDTAIPSYPEAPKTLGDAVNRPAEYFVPESYTPEKKWPLVVLLHGYSASGWLQDGYFGLSERVDERGFLLITPDGTKDQTGVQFWNGTDACCDFYDTEVDDVGYITGLIDEMTSYFRVDTDRVYLIGHSNGGYMSFRLACDASEKITAIASLAGLMFADWQDCPATSPVSVLQMHGTLDDLVPYEGGPGLPSAMQTTEMWAAHNDCKTGPTEGTPIDIEEYIDGAETLVTNWTDCQSNAGVSLWTIDEGEHVPAFKPIYTTMILDWLFSKTR